MLKERFSRFERKQIVKEIEENQEKRVRRKVINTKRNNTNSTSSHNRGITDIGRSNNQFAI